MTPFLITLFENNHWLLYVLLSFVAFFLVLGAIGVIQGREVSLYPPKIGKKVEKESKGEKPQQQVTSVQTNVYTGTPSVEEIKESVKQSVKEIQSEVNNKLPDVLYQPPKLSARIAYIYSARHDIMLKMKQIAFKYQDEYELFVNPYPDFYFVLEKMTFTRALSKEVKDSLVRFYNFSNYLINSNEISDKEFLEIQYLALDLSKKLDEFYFQSRKSKRARYKQPSSSK